MDSKIKDFVVRVASAAAMAVVVLCATYYSYWSFGLLLVAITVGGVSEFFEMARAKGYHPHTIMGYAAAVAMFGWGYDFFYNGSANNVNIALFLMLVIPLIFAAELFKGGDKPFENIGSTLIPLIYVAVPMAMMAGVPLLITGGEWRPEVMILYFCIIWANDSFAYMVGVVFGRNRLNEKISPKKSWEGFAGGVVGSLLVVTFAANVLGESIYMWLGLGAVVSIMGCVGDLVESMFKRSCGVKDSGKIMPGHGGWLDRFDSLIFSAPFSMIFLMFFKHLLG